VEKQVNKMTRADLIQEINVLGPWVHGYFDLGHGLIIEDQDELQKRRLFHLRDYYRNILESYYGSKQLKDKTLADVGCNTGYFLFELFNTFQFKRADGLEPRKSNLSKAKFIAEYFNVPKNRVRFRKYDILSHHRTLPVYDVVLMSGLIHHLDNHLLALSNAYRMTKDLCIIETMVLPDEVNTSLVRKSLELKDDAYKKFDYGFGVMGYKFESNYLDGAAARSGIVGIPSEKALTMMLYHVGFNNVRVYRDNRQMKKEVYNIPSYRELNSAIIVAEKREEEGKRPYLYFSKYYEEEEQNNFDLAIPIDIIAPLYNVLTLGQPEDTLSGLPRLVYLSELYYTEKRGEEAFAILAEKMGQEAYYQIIRTFRHAPKDKVSYEYAKTSFHEGRYEAAQEVLEKLIATCNLDWRTVFRTYYLLARISLHHCDRTNAKRYNDLSLRAYAYYAPALSLSRQLS